MPYGPEDADCLKSSNEAGKSKHSEIKLYDDGSATSANARDEFDQIPVMEFPNRLHIFFTLDQLMLLPANGIDPYRAF